MRGEEGDGEAPDEEAEDAEGEGEVDGDGDAAAVASSLMAAARVSGSWLVEGFGEVGWPGPVGIRRVWGRSPVPPWGSPRHSSPMYYNFFFIHNVLQLHTGK